MDSFFRLAGQYAEAGGSAAQDGRLPQDGARAEAAPAHRRVQLLPCIVGILLHRQNDDDAPYTGITGASVYAVGYDDDFILVKAYRALKDSMGISLQRYNKNTTEYYIIPVNNAQEAWEAQENKFGAFSKKGFEVKRKELGVSDDITFKRL